MRTIGSVAVLGAGTMGSGIAQVVARSGVPVKLYDALPGAAERSSARVTSDLQRLAERGKISPPDAAAAAERVSAAGTLADLAGADLVVEAVPEDLELKRRLFRDIDELLPGAVLATNTSTLSVSAIAGAVRDPSRVAGMHFFNPAPLMP
ncbi:MAG TPA: 3-hydroxyacyl-CoA dehydrogenase NAD-binding domain-containing protein, partial [Deinococcales bacterium]|nr:3-hydroxyacyl-CoA dehydrogenase NAD-binding domain-containing protein [Deinococcales bacterium]